MPQIFMNFITNLEIVFMYYCVSKSIQINNKTVQFGLFMKDCSVTVENFNAK